MVEKQSDRSGILNGVARVMNTGGNSVVYAYDATHSAFGRLVSIAKKAPGVPGIAKGIFTSSLGLVVSSDTRKAEEKIKEYEEKIRSLYFKIGKEGADASDMENPLEAESVKNLIADVREYEKEIQRLKDRIVEMKEERKAEGLLKKEDKAKTSLIKMAGERAAHERVFKKVQDAIETSARQGEFESDSDRAIFDKVAHDLLDSEIEIKILATVELGKISNSAAVPILIAAVNFDYPDLTSEIINSLILLGDDRAIPVFKELSGHSKYGVRVGCLRGLYKMAEDEEAGQLLINALRDDHPEVRKNAATFLGWKDYADSGPALVQCLRDEDVKVRKAAVWALANLKEETFVLSLIRVLGDEDLEIREKTLEAIQGISGVEVAFDVTLSGRALTEAVDKMKDWWQQERLQMKEPVEEDEVEAARTEEAESDEAKEDEDKPELTRENLSKITKADLFAICDERGIEYKPRDTKDEIIGRLLESEE